MKGNEKYENKLLTPAVPIIKKENRATEAEIKRAADKEKKQ